MDVQNRGNLLESEVSDWIVEIKHKHKIILFIVLAIGLMLFGFVFLHVVFNAGENAIFIFVAWEVPKGILLAIGFTCVGASLVIFLIIILELAFNPKQMMKLRTIRD